MNWLTWLIVGWVALSVIFTGLWVLAAWWFERPRRVRNDRRNL